MEKKLNGMGIFSIGQLARYDLETLEKKFGIMGNQLYHHAWGVDLSDIGAPIMEGQISFGKGQVLLRDYKKPEEIKHVILEMSEEVARRTRASGMAGRTVSLGIYYSQDEFGGGFHRSMTRETPTNITMDIYEMCLTLFERFYTGKTVRKISITLSNVIPDREMQISLFDQDSWRKRELGFVMDRMRKKFGSNAILRAVSYTEAGTAKHRSTLVGGHRA